MNKNNPSKRNGVSIMIIASLLAIIVIGLGVKRFSRSSGGNVANDIVESLVGKPAPAFSLTDRDGNVYDNEKLKGKRIVLFFNEGLICYPACWNQMLEFPKDKRFNQEDIAIFSVVVDTKESWQKAVEKMPEMGDVKALFDNEKRASKDFQMLSAPSSMHTGNLPGHTYVIVDKDGIIRYVFDDPKMAINNGTIYSEIEKLK